MSAIAKANGSNSHHDGVPYQEYIGKIEDSMELLIAYHDDQFQALGTRIISPECKGTYFEMLEYRVAFHTCVLEILSKENEKLAKLKHKPIEACAIKISDYKKKISALNAKGESTETKKCVEEVEEEISYMQKEYKVLQQHIEAYNASLYRSLIQNLSSPFTSALQEIRSQGQKAQRTFDVVADLRNEIANIRKITQAILQSFASFSIYQPPALTNLHQKYSSKWKEVVRLTEDILTPLTKNWDTPFNQSAYNTLVFCAEFSFKLTYVNLDGRIPYRIMNEPPPQDGFVTKRTVDQVNLKGKGVIVTLKNGTYDSLGINSKQNRKYSNLVDLFTDLTTEWVQSHNKEIREETCPHLFLPSLTVYTTEVVVMGLPESVLNTEKCKNLSGDEVITDQYMNKLQLDITITKTFRKNELDSSNTLDYFYIIKGSDTYKEQNETIMKYIKDALKRIKEICDSIQAMETID